MSAVLLVPEAELPDKAGGCTSAFADDLLSASASPSDAGGCRRVGEIAAATDLPRSTEGDGTACAPALTATDAVVPFILLGELAGHVTLSPLDKIREFPEAFATEKSSRDSRLARSRRLTWLAVGCRGRSRMKMPLTQRKNHDQVLTGLAERPA